MLSLSTGRLLQLTRSNAAFRLKPFSRAFSQKTDITQGLEIANYFKPNISLQAVKNAHSERADLPDLQTKVAVSGRIIGRRKASANLIFLDLESNG